MNFAYLPTSVTETNKISIECNAHYDGPFTSESLHETIDVWSECQNDIKIELDKLLEGGK